MTQDANWGAVSAPDVVGAVDFGEAGPYAVAFGSAGEMWVTLINTGELVRRSPEGSEHRFPVGERPGQLAVTPHATWCAVSGEDRIAIVTSDGQLSFVDTPGGPYGMAASGNGVWTAFMQGNKLAMVESSGPRDDMPLPVEGAFPAMVTVDDQGCVWTSLNQAGALARRSTSGALDLIHLPEGAAPVGLATAGGQVWTADIARGRILLVDQSLQIREFALDPESRPHAVIADENGCWFTEWGANRLGRITLDGELTELDLTDAGKEPHGLARDDDGNVWVAFENGPVVGFQTATPESPYS